MDGSVRFDTKPVQERFHLFNPRPLASQASYWPDATAPLSPWISLAMITSIFVYGTLKRGHVRGGMWPAPPLNIQPAVTLGALYDLGSYPGMVEGHDWILGELWTLAPEDMDETLRILDGIEGYDSSTDSGLYLRRIVDVQSVQSDASGEIVTQQAFAYQIAELSRIAHARRIDPSLECFGLRVAQWPDAMARVPSRIEDE